MFKILFILHKIQLNLWCNLYSFVDFLKICRQMNV